MSRDMTKGNITKHITLFSIPLFIIGICQTLYNFIDAMVVGRFVSANALASVGTCASIILFFMVFSNGFGVGFRVITGQLFGSGEHKMTKLSVTTSLIVMAALSVVCCALGIIFSRLMLVALGVPEDLMSDALLYLQIYFYGLPFIIMYNGISNLFYALGDSKIPMLTQIICFVLNIGLELALVAVFDMGVAGVAWSGFITRGINFLIVLIAIFKKTHKFPKSDKIFDFKIFKKILSVGFPASIAHSIGAINSLVIHRLINSFDTPIIAGYNIAAKIDSLFMLFINTIASSCGTLVSQNYGARDMHRVRRGFKLCMLLNACYSLLTIVFARLFGTQLTNLFMNADTDIMLKDDITSFVTNYILIISIFYFIYGVGHVANELLRCVGKIKITVFSTLIVVLARICLAYLLSNYIGPAAIYWSLPISWFSGYVITITYTFTYKWLPHIKGLRSNKQKVLAKKV